MIGAALFFVVTALLVFSQALYAFEAPPVGDDNLLANPWFRAPDDPTASSLDSWTDADGPDQYWSSSQKESNLSPDAFPSNVCGPEPLYCGTLARLSLTPGQSGGVAVTGITATLYQVVSTDAANRQLSFATHWVSHIVEPAEANIYGGHSAIGPWNLVWQPLTHTQLLVVKPPPGGTVADLWEHTGPLTTTLESGFPFYNSRAPPGDKPARFRPSNAIGSARFHRRICLPRGLSD